MCFFLSLRTCWSHFHVWETLWILTTWHPSQSMSAFPLSQLICTVHPICNLDAGLSNLDFVTLSVAWQRSQPPADKWNDPLSQFSMSYLCYAFDQITVRRQDGEARSTPEGKHAKCQRQHLNLERQEASTRQCEDRNYLLTGALRQSTNVATHPITPRAAWPWIFQSVKLYVRSFRCFGLDFLLSVRRVPTSCRSITTSCNSLYCPSSASDANEPCHNEIMCSDDCVCLTQIQVVVCVQDKRQHDSFRKMHRIAVQSVRTSIQPKQCERSARGCRVFRCSLVCSTLCWSAEESSEVKPW